jgi:hypothetical protein
LAALFADPDAWCATTLAQTTGIGQPVWAAPQLAHV